MTLKVIDHKAFLMLWKGYMVFLFSEPYYHLDLQMDNFSRCFICRYRSFNEAYFSTDSEVSKLERKFRFSGQGQASPSGCSKQVFILYFLYEENYKKKQLLYIFCYPNINII